MSWGVAVLGAVLGLMVVYAINPFGAVHGRRRR